MGAIDELRSLVDAQDPFGDHGRDLDRLRLAAANERLREQRPLVRALDQRLTEAGMDIFKSAEDLVPALFAHSVYKSYPESFVSQGRWVQLSRWLETVATGQISAVDVSDVGNIDDWMDRLDRSGFHLIVSSGTTGKNSFLVMDDADVEFISWAGVRIIGFPYRIPRRNDRPVTLLSPGNAPMRFCYLHRANAAAFGRPGAIRSLTNEPVLVSDTLRQVTMRRSMADGTVSPSALAAYEAEANARSHRLNEAIDQLAQTIVSYRDEPQLISGPWATAWRVMESAHAAGVADGGFHPDTVVSINGGLKGLSLPADYDDQMSRFFGSVHRHRLYSMSEQSTPAPMCEAGNYHWPQWMMLFVLDESGERLEPVDGSGRVRGRIGFYDPMWHGRWGGIASGDQATVDFSARCACGRPGPTIEDSIVRYSQLSPAGDDKLTCGGTIEAYIRGIVGEQS